MIGVIDDDASVRSALKRLFQTAGFNVALFATAEEYLANPNRAEIDCLAIDVRLPGMGGLELLEQIRLEGETPALVMTANDTEDVRARALAAGAIGFFVKPFDNRVLLSAVCNTPGVSVNNSRQQDDIPRRRNSSWQ